MPELSQSTGTMNVPCFSSYLGRCRPAQSWVTDSSQYPFSLETEAVLLRFPLQ
jgi:hypothetical protein